MAKIPSPPVPVRVVSGPPLLRTGLERAARSAGFSVTSGDQAPVSLRSSDQPAADAGVDIAVGPDAVAVTIKALPELRTWDAILALIAELLSGSSLTPKL